MGYRVRMPLFFGMITVALALLWVGLRPGPWKL
jgi:hypothetical protein